MDDSKRSSRVAAAIIEFDATRFLFMGHIESFICEMKPANLQVLE